MPTSPDGFLSALASAVSGVDIPSLLADVLLSLAAVSATIATVILVWIVIVIPVRLILAAAHSGVRWLARANWLLARRLLRGLLVAMGGLVLVAFVAFIAVQALFQSNPLAEFLLVGLVAPALVVGMPSLLWRVFFKTKHPTAARSNSTQVPSQNGGD